MTEFRISGPELKDEDYNNPFMSNNKQVYNAFEGTLGSQNQMERRKTHEPIKRRPSEDSPEIEFRSP